MKMYRLMIVEDEMIERIVLRKMLQKKFGEFCVIYEAQNGKEAVEIFRREDIQIVILDIGMPGMNGIEAAQVMRKENNGCCLIFLTAYDRFDYARKAVSIRAMEYLLKPYSQKEIINVVEEAIRIVQEKNGMEVTSAKSGLSEREDSLVVEDADFNSSRLTVMTAMVEEYIKTHFMEDISMGEAARAIGYSEPYFCKMFKQQHGQNFTSYLTDYRINEAKKLLEKPNVIVKEVGARVGYGDSNYFTKVFKRLEGMNPSEYRMTKLKEL